MTRKVIIMKTIRRPKDTDDEKRRENIIDARFSPISSAIIQRLECWKRNTDEIEYERIFLLVYYSKHVKIFRFLL